MKFRRLLPLMFCCVVFASASDKTTAHSSGNGSPYLFVVAGDQARKSTDFLAVIDANPASPRYGQIVHTVPFKAAGTMPHHTEYESPSGTTLFANGWAAGRTFVFDVRNPKRPRIVKKFSGRGGYLYPHSFVRMANGHVLATFQSRGPGYAPGGGLVELDERASVVRSASAVDPAVSTDRIWPYSLAIVPKLGLVVSSSTPMGMPQWATLPAGSWPVQKIDDQVTSEIQIWRLSDLKLLHTISLPDDGSGFHNRYPAEPRTLENGDVYVNTF